MGEQHASNRTCITTACRSFFEVRASLNLKGRRFTRLTVLAPAGSTRNHKRLWYCLCKCGKKVKIISSHLINGNTKSCGCLSSEVSRAKAIRRNKTQKPSLTHGDLSNNSESSEYQAWRAMKDRCLRPKNAAFSYYGGRGITVCERWKHSFENFLIDMGRKPNSTFSLDRMNPNDGYNPSNCRWATKQTQVLNRRKYYVFIPAYSDFDFEGLGVS